MRRLLDKHGLSPIKSLGQHFLADPNLTRRVVAAAGIKSGDRVLEVGAGTGTLTRALAEAGANVLTLEVDPRLQPVLEEALAETAVDLRIVDALEFDYATELVPGRWKMVSNLPYEIGTILLLDLVRHAPVIDSFTVMVQEEVARRLTAVAGSRDYGLPSVVVGSHGEARLLFTVPPQVFFPPPRVESAVIQIVRRAASPDTERAIELAALAFGQRRKMLRSSLRGALADSGASLVAAGIEPTLRPESLTPEDFLRLAGAAS
ncbi:MAG TPA: 16S rRNA (adenine(1518)-N(6)/adenine(1519)-N(6))-dimethyltransferase RsmA [Acidimicrobiia bacterium]|nr:16S rRNA (adenine(1518)-N(6)/adenine(1519)-N(6))-dimethyltransferase RsmA [Acidimicrobiia bacterium]